MWCFTSTPRDECSITQFDLGIMSLCTVRHVYHLCGQHIITCTRVLPCVHTLNDSSKEGQSRLTGRPVTSITAVAWIAASECGNMHDTISNLNRCNIALYTRNLHYLASLGKASTTLLDLHQWFPAWTPLNVIKLSHMHNAISHHPSTVSHWPCKLSKS